MTMQDRDPIQSLGLPHPDKLDISDKEFLKTYKEFCLTLHFLNGEKSIACDSTFFDFTESCDKISSNQIPKLKLLSALLRSDKTQLAKIKGKLRDFEEYLSKRRVYSGYIYDISLGAALKEFSSFRETKDFALLTKNASAAKLLFDMWATVSTGPGVDWYSYIEVSEYNKAWAIVLYYGDSENCKTEAFPHVLGFARRDRLQRSVATLLANEQTYYASEYAEMDDDSLCHICWRRFGLDLDINYGKILLKFTDKELALLSKGYGGLDSQDMIDALESIRETCDNVPELWSLDLEEVFDKIFEWYGRPKEKRYFHKVLKKLEDQYQRE